MRTKLITAMILTAFFFATVSLFAQVAEQTEKPGMQKGPGMLKGLNLTEEQKLKVQQINLDREKEMIKIQSAIQLKRVELKEILAEKQVNTSKLTTITEEIGKLELQVKKMRTENWIKVNSLLNDTQKEVWKKHFAREGFMNQRGGMGKGMMQNRTGHPMMQGRMGQKMHKMSKNVEKEVIIEKK
jgi:Spy/CpxP family protein refolding chaperone